MTKKTRARAFSNVFMACWLTGLFQGALLNVDAAQYPGVVPLVAAFILTALCMSGFWLIENATAWITGTCPRFGDPTPALNRISDVLIRLFRR